MDFRDELLNSVFFGTPKYQIGVCRETLSVIFAHASENISLNSLWNVEYIIIF